MDLEFLNEKRGDVLSLIGGMSQASGGEGLSKWERFKTRCEGEEGGGGGGGEGMEGLGGTKGAR